MKTRTIQKNHLFKKDNWKDYLFLLLLALLCYWPLPFGIFSAKNDNIIAVLPFRYNISEAIRSGHLPLWSPYIYLGFPLHGDMQSGCWNPFVWLFSLFSVYNLTVLHFEILLYIFISGLSMYKFLDIAGMPKVVRLTGAAVYMMSGFITDVGGSNILFLASAAFIPYVFGYYYLFLKNNSLLNALKFTIALSLLFLTGYPSFFILTCYILLAAFLVYIFLRIKNKAFSLQPLQKLLLYHLLIGVVFLLLCAPAILSYFQILPYYQRGSGINLAQSYQNSIQPSCLQSILLPMAAIKDPSSFSTDLISRNLYFNCCLLVFLLSATIKKQRALTLFILSGILFFLLFSLGSYTPVRTWTYHWLPLMNTFRHPSNARLFIIIGAIFLSSHSIAEITNSTTQNRIKKISILCLLALLVAWIAITFNRTTISHQLSGFNQSQGNIRDKLKQLLDQLNYADAVLINGSLQIIFLAILLFQIGKPTLLKKTLPYIVITNSLLVAQLTIPFTLVSHLSPKEINNYFYGFGKGYSIPDLQSTIQQNSKDALSNYTQIGISTFYNKNIGMSFEQVTPTFMIQIEQLNSDSSVKNYVLGQPVAYLADSLFQHNGQTIAGISKAQNEEKEALKITGITNHSFDFITNTKDSKLLCLQQVHLPGWKATVDGQATSIRQANIAFMSVTIPTGYHKINFTYEPKGIITALIISIITGIFVLSLFIFKRKL